MFFPSKNRKGHKWNNTTTYTFCLKVNSTMFFHFFNSWKPASWKQSTGGSKVLWPASGEMLNNRNMWKFSSEFLTQVRQRETTGKQSTSKTLVATYCFCMRLTLWCMTLEVSNLIGTFDDVLKKTQTEAMQV